MEQIYQKPETAIEQIIWRSEGLFTKEVQRVKCLNNPLQENAPAGAATPEQGARKIYHLQNKPKKTVCQMEKKNEQNKN